MTTAPTSEPVPYNLVRVSPHGAAIAWYAPIVEDDAEPWLVVVLNDVDGPVWSWRPDADVADWAPLGPIAALAADLAQVTRERDRVAARHGQFLRGLAARLGAADQAWCQRYGTAPADPAYWRWIAVAAIGLTPASRLPRPTPIAATSTESGLDAQVSGGDAR